MLGVDSPVRVFLELLKASRNVFDVAAACFHMIKNTQRGYEAGFILEIDEMRKSPREEHVKELENLRKDLREIVKCEYSENTCDRHGKQNFRNILTNLTQLIEHFKIPKGIEEEKCVAYCAFYIIEAIDAQLQIDDLDKDSGDIGNGPLNENVCKDDCFVYLHERSSFLSEIYSRGDEGFRKPLRPIRVGSIFRKLLILDKSDFCMSAPKIVRVSLPDECKKQLSEEKYLRIASIPFIGFDTFDFCNADSNSICNGVPDGAFYVQYNEKSEQGNIVDMLRALKSAIQHKANIVIFPEFIMSPNMLKELISFLKKEKPKSLALVLAGTTYEHLSDGIGNNVMHIFNGRGYCFGKYYKFSPFLTREHEFVHGTAYGENQNDNCGSRCLCDKDVLATMRYLRNGEVLSEPGKECTIVDIDGIGRILPAVCRDVTDGYYTDNLAKLFMPSFLFIPSWSPSINSFRTRLTVLAETIHTTSVLCNCCNAVSHDREYTGLLLFPQKQDSEMVAQERFLSHCRGCIDSRDKKCKGCFHLIDIKCEGNTLNAEIQHIIAEEHIALSNV